MSERMQNSQPEELSKNAAVLGESVRPSMASLMHVELVVNPDSQVWVLHDKPFPALLEWAEYDAESRSLSFVTHDGVTQDVGMTIPDSVHVLLRKAGEICAILMQDGKIQDMGFVPVTVRETVS